jgi:two-component system cell cycle response regulator CtrA
MRVLIVEDDGVMARNIELVMASERLTTHITELGEEAVDLGKRYEYDAILLDLNLPDMPGLRVIQDLRKAKVHTPVFVLSGDATVDARVKALSAGADEYLVKPFHKDELIARLRAVLRRSQSRSHSLITIGKLTLNLDDKSVRVGGGSVDLTVKEYQVFEALCLRKGSTLSKDSLLNHLYNGLDEPEQKIIDVFVCKLRKKLMAATKGENCITTVWGRGYQLDDPAPLPIAC